MKLSRCETVQDIKPLNKNSKGMHIGHDGQTLKPSIKSLEERQRSLGFFSRQMVSVGTDQQHTFQMAVAGQMSAMRSISNTMNGNIPGPNIESSTGPITVDNEFLINTKTTVRETEES